ncbi:MAG: hypothetical protein MK085_02740 [Phycisphaerales bacterium]|nr:hypothetical protein [Phycisphaerales bacterium]
MHDTTTSLTDLMKKIHECLVDRDLDAAAFLREGVFEQVRLHGAWLSPTEDAFLESF